MESNCRDFWRGGGGASLPPPPPLSPPPPPPTSPGPFLHPFCGPPPPFPPPRRQRNRSSNGSSSNVPWWKAWMKKYVVFCLICGGLSVVIGIVLIVIYLLLRSYTSSLQFFETIPTYVPGVVLIITGLIVICFAKRKNRYAYLMKIAGGCCLICALLCVVITVTTTVVHMNRLQTLHECVYTPQAKTCMCVSAIADHHNSQDAHRFVFNNTPNCEVVHGSLYACLRALFSFSVIGILVCIFSSMLVYQLLSHEKKRIYWEQLELRRRFLYQRHPHHAVCGCYDDMYPWHLWEMLDYRVLASHALLPDRCSTIGEDERQQQQTVTNVSGNGLGGGGHRASGWNWLPWPRQNTSQRNNSNTNNVSSDSTSIEQSFRRLLSNERWNRQLITSNSSPPEETALQGDSTGPWRSECIHIFRPSPRSGNCVPPVRFGIRSRSSPYGRHQFGHRRTRSNDGVFHHLHMNSAPRYSRHYPLPDANAISCHFSSFEVPRYMWGPPPPYSQPPSIENIPAYNGSNSHDSHRPTSGRSIEISHCEQMLSALEQAGTGSVSSKMSTPLSERRYLCHNFSSDGITLTIEGNFNDLHTQNRINSENKRDETCIVEVHVPYILDKDNIVFNTLPTRSCRKKDINPFKSLSNIPLGLSRKFNSLKSEKKEQLSVIETCCELSEEVECSFNNEKEISAIQSSQYSTISEKNVSEQKACDERTISVSPVIETSSNSPIFQPTMVEIPPNFRSNLMIATSPSTPVTESIALKDAVYTQSMPNLSISNSPLTCHIRRVPSSGNTSTSQDFCDFDFDEDSSPLVLCSPVSDIQADDNASDTSWVFPKYPRRFRYIKDSKVPFFSESSSDSCDVTVSGVDHRCVSPTISNNSATSNDVLINSTEQEQNKIEIVHKPHSHKHRSIIPLSSSIIISDGPSMNCSINCNIHHLHHYYPARRNVREVPESVRDNNLLTRSDDRSNDFIVTIKSINV